jgi:NAD(P) transhydrogenase
MATGFAASLAYMNPADISTYGQLMMLGAGGGSVGYYLSTKIGPTELPQAVAAFHSLVGLAATFTAVGDYMGHDPTVHASAFHNISTYLGAWVR